MCHEVRVFALVITFFTSKKKKKKKKMHTKSRKSHPEGSVKIIALKHSQSTVYELTYYELTYNILQHFAA